MRLISAAPNLLKRCSNMFLRVLLISIVLQTLVRSATAQDAHMFCLSSVQNLKARVQQSIDSTAEPIARLRDEPADTSLAIIRFNGLTYEGSTQESVVDDLPSPFRLFHSTAGQLFRLWSRFQVEQTGAVFMPVFQSAQLRFCYSDIFETRAHPERGGHGPSILFRYSFRR